MEVLADILLLLGLFLFAIGFLIAITSQFISACKKGILEIYRDQLSWERFFKNKMEIRGMGISFLGVIFILIYGVISEYFLK